MLSIAELIYIKGSIYKLMKKKMTYADAQKSCKKWHCKSHLASIHTMEEHDALIKLLKNFQVSSAWLGANDQGKEGAWQWDDQTKFSWSKWAPGEPNNLGGGQDCLLLVQDLWKKMGWSSHQNVWDDATCPEKHAFICKI